MESMVFNEDCVAGMERLYDQYGAFADAIITSPPYADQRKYQYGGVHEKDFPQWTVQWMKSARKILKPTGSILINIRPHIKSGEISDYVLKTILAIRADGWKHCEDIVWYKPDSPPLGSIERPRRAWEMIHWFSPTHKPYQDCKAGGVVSDRIGFENNKFEHGGKSHIHAGQSLATTGKARVTDVVIAGTSRIEKGFSHEAMYPLDIPEYCINLCCPDGGIVVDPFSGSGTTIRKAVQMGRTGIGFELKEAHCAEAMNSIKNAQISWVI